MIESSLSLQVGGHYALPSSAEIYRPRDLGGLCPRGVDELGIDRTSRADPRGSSKKYREPGLNRRLQGAWGSSRSFVVGARFPQFTESGSRESGMERRRSLQTKTSQTQLSHGTFVEQPSRSLLTTSLTVGRLHVYGPNGLLRGKTGGREVSARTAQPRTERHRE